MDKFARIAKNKVPERESLKERVPDKISQRFLTIQKENGYRPTFCEISTREELENELRRQRKIYSPFLQDYAKKRENGFKTIEIKEFVADGGKVTLPDYGGPLGYNKKTYISVFSLQEKRKDKNYRVKFGGVDYIAYVYVNDVCVGSHEGFFSPFWFDVTNVVRQSENVLKVEVYNDCVYMGNEDENGKEVVEGDKLYAATGLGWDDSETGWHHCPPGSGIWGYVRVEECSDLIIDDIFVRPLVEENEIEVWTEVYSFDYNLKKFSLTVDIEGQNFIEEKVKDFKYIPSENIFAKKGLNVFKFRIPFENYREWDISSPWLYKITLGLYSEGKEKDVRQEQFGIRTFLQDCDNTPKGTFYLNGEKIRLCGANTMGFEQQDVLRGDLERLIEDILLAKICGMNFWRLTQHPVQKEVYEYCDKLGLLTQTDLPLFGCMRRTKFAEGLRQAEEMEKIARNHPCNVICSLINEPFPDGHWEPHRHLVRMELESFFDCAEKIIKLNNPDRVLKYADGDYDPPCKGLPDNHCYTLWYNNHSIDFGKLNKGYWIPIKEDWRYGCGEFGAESLDFPDLMRRRYPKEWLKEPFSPANILRAQTADFYCCFYPEQHTMEKWVEESQKHQAFATKFMTEAFRRDALNNSFAIHLFIDAWPNGWMKAIMDCERNPKPAYFAYKKAMQTVLISLRTDRFTCFSDEDVTVESFICNNGGKIDDGRVVYLVKNESGEIVLSEEARVRCESCESEYIHTLKMKLPTKIAREKFIIEAYFSDGVSDSKNDLTIEVFERPLYKANDQISIVQLNSGNASAYGVTEIKDLVQGGVNFVEVDEKIFDGYLRSDDLRFLYDEKLDRISFITSRYFVAGEDFTILIKAKSYRDVDMENAALMAYKKVDGNIIVLTTMDIRRENPAMEMLVKFLNEQIM